jgi:hypothetical protein
MIQFDSGYFCAAVELDTDTDRVTSAAPILKYMVGWTKLAAVGYATRKGWKIINVP